MTSIVSTIAGKIQVHGCHRESATFPAHAQPFGTAGRSHAPLVGALEFDTPYKIKQQFDEFTILYRIFRQYE